MELRSTRSRSRTPFLQNTQTFIEGGSFEEEAVITRTTRSTTVKSVENVTSSVANSTRSLRSKGAKADKSVHKVLYKTSDYSSEDGETEISSTRHVTENDRNQLIEDAKSAANGTSEVSALGLYRKAGRYWDVYPKTDWTYSRSSRDRVELAPGVVAMPNMSRRSLHSRERSTEHLLSHHKDSVEETRSSANYAARNSVKYQPRTLFTNNNYDSDYEYTVSHSSNYRKQKISRFYSFFYSVYTLITSVVYTAFYYQSGGLIWLGKKVHTLVSRLMLLDTFLLSRKSNRKLSGILWLCLLPLLLFGGWYLLTTLGRTLYGAYMNSSTPVVIGNTPEDVHVPVIVEKFEDNSGRERREAETVNLRAADVAAQLSDDQLEIIASNIKNSLTIENKINTNDVVERLLQSNEVKNIFNNYNTVNLHAKDFNEDLIRSQEKIIDDLKQQINQIKIELEDMEKARNKEVDTIIQQFRIENSRSNARLYHELKSCCRKSFINIEAYVAKALKDFFANPNFSDDREELSKWLHSIFVAKQDLETHLANATENLHSHFDVLVENSGKRIMDDVASKISLELQQNLRNLQSKVEKSESTVVYKSGGISDEHIRKIVKDTLAIYDADKTGLVDYAMEPMGGQVLSTRCTESYQAGTAVVSVLGIPLWYPTNTPRTVITPGINPGECWAFQNFPGFLVVKLANPILIDAFSYEHISKKLIPNGKIDSAPKEFEVYGLRNESDKDPIKLGTYKYDIDGESLQFFAAANHGVVLELIELRVLSNHGNPNYTCLYRFRVHGKISREPT